MADDKKIVPLGMKRVRVPPPANDCEPPSPRMIKSLEQLLEDAKAGRLRGIAYAGVLSDMCTIDFIDCAEGIINDRLGTSLRILNFTYEHDLMATLTVEDGPEAA